MPEPYVYQLKHPIEIRSKDGNTVVETITEVKLNRPKGKHLKATDKVTGEAAKTLALIAACGNIPASMVDEMDGEDVTELGEVLEGFFGRSRGTGQTSSEM